MKLVHQIKYPKPITSMTLTDDMSHLAIGMADGMVAVTKNKEKERKIEEIVRNPTQLEVANDSAFLLNIPTSNKALDYKFFYRGIYKKNPRDEVDAVVELKRAKNLAQYDNYLKKFRYGDALAEAVSTKNTNIILAVVEELAFRDGLEIALSNLPERCLPELLGFIYKKCDSAEHQRMILLLLDLVVNRANKICPPSLAASLQVDNLLRDISTKLAAEYEASSEMGELHGLIEQLDYLS